jgi:hypothetical protein
MKEEKRETNREPLRIPAKLILDDGDTLYGETADISPAGIFFQFNKRAPEDMVGPSASKGMVVLFINSKRRECILEMRCNVARREKSGMGLAMAVNKEIIDGVESLCSCDITVDPKDSHIHMFDDKGAPDDGWSLVFHNDHIPETIYKEYRRKSKRGVCFVSRKYDGAKTRYKIIALREDVKVYQMSADDAVMNGNIKNKQIGHLIKAGNQGYITRLLDKIRVHPSRNT